MAWVAVDKDEMECIYESKPKRIKLAGGTWVDDCDDNNWLVLPPGSIEKLIGKKLTWEDEPVEIK